jgi:hypothetical protein
MSTEHQDELKRQIKLLKYYEQDATRRSNRAKGPTAAQSAARAAARYKAEREQLETQVA